MEKHFVLIHGGCFGAWAWYKVVTILESNGYKATALDMASSGINPRRTDEVKSYSDYSEPLIKFMEDLPSNERVVLVGHSLAGVIVSLAMEKFPQKIAAGVFLTAVMPSPEITMATLHEEHKEQIDTFMDCQMIHGNGDDNPPTAFLFGLEYLKSKVFQLCPPEDMTLASLLVRPISLAIEQGELDIPLTQINYGSVPRIYLISENDNVTKVEVQRWMVDKNPPEEVFVIPSCDHMVMLSNPKDLSSRLLEIAHKYD
ncbi:hypothetical protein ACH5RR_012241 [Cinchona calisaya]|uniref:AB hydrolase-1 domain-containing protein n=1 Tax=Cinchona calisaya TaxID=153742 RepID=A0ABD3A739_9GENT